MMQKKVKKWPKSQIKEGESAFRTTLPGSEILRSSKRKLTVPVYPHSQSNFSFS